MTTVPPIGRTCQPISSHGSPPASSTKSAELTASSTTSPPSPPPRSSGNSAEITFSPDRWLLQFPGSPVPPENSPHPSFDCICDCRRRWTSLRSRSAAELEGKSCAHQPGYIFREGRPALGENFIERVLAYQEAEGT